MDDKARHCALSARCTHIFANGIQKMKRTLQILVPLAAMSLIAGCGAGEDGLDSGIDDSCADNGV